MATIEQRIRDHALELGLDGVGFAPAVPAEHLQFYLNWLAAGHHGEQSYLARPDRVARRQDLNLILPGVQSLVVVARHYWLGPEPAELTAPDRGRISMYARGTDYHAALLPQLNRLLTLIQTEAGRPVRGRAYVDTGPLLEREHARRAGLGFIGKNCSLIQPRRGSWLFLGVLLVDLALEPSATPGSPTCGACERCLAVCPTGALVAPYTLDSRRCISYWTTYLSGIIPRAWRPWIGNQVFGCDLCQSVCPWNRFATPAATMGQVVAGAPPLIPLLALSEIDFAQRYGRTPIGHLGRERFLRNVAVALGNWGAPKIVAPLAQALAEPSPTIRAHAAWALGRTEVRQAKRALEKARSREDDPAVMEEIMWALAETE